MDHDRIVIQAGIIQDVLQRDVNQINGERGLHIIRLRHESHQDMVSADFHELYHLEQAAVIKVLFKQENTVRNTEKHHKNKQRNKAPAASVVLQGLRSDHKRDQNDIHDLSENAVAFYQLAR